MWKQKHKLKVEVNRMMAFVEQLVVEWCSDLGAISGDVFMTLAESFGKS